MKLSLKRPIVFFDLETTGLNVVTDRIVEISYIKVYPDGREEQDTRRINPGIPIPKEATALHHISDDDVKGEPYFKQYAKHFAKIIQGCDLAGFNSNKFDIPLLAEEFVRAEVDFDFTRCKFVDVQVIFHKMERRDLTAAYKFYCHKDLEGAHGAAADIRATYDVLLAQLDRYQGVEYKDNTGKVTTPIVNDIDTLSEFSVHKRSADLAEQLVYNDKGEIVFNFGKYKGMPVVEAFKKDQGYYGWILNGEFPQYTKRVLTQVKLSMGK